MRTVSSYGVEIRKQNIPVRQTMEIYRQAVSYLTEIYVQVWEELREIMEWTKTHVTSTLHLCWGAQAGLYYHYGIDKVQLPKKMFGVFRHRVRNRRIPLVRGFDDVFYAPHSRHTEVRAEDIRAVKQAVGEKVLKVIIETCYLTEEEKIAMCKAVTDAGADFIKTSTGFGTGGATKEDVELFKKYIGPKVKIKAAGGVSSMEDLEMFLELGCDRIGTSRAVGLCKGELTEGY